MLITTRTLGNRALRSVLAMLRKYLISTAPALILRRVSRFLSRFDDDPGCRLHRHEQHDVVVDEDVVRPLAQPEPLAGLDRLRVVAAAEEADLAEIVDRRLDLHAHHLALAVRLLDLGKGHFDEVGALEHGGERFDQIGVMALERGVVDARRRCELGIEVEIGVTQLLELVEILVVIDRRQQPADLAELAALLLAAEGAMLDQRVENVGLADGDELVAFASPPRRDGLEMRLSWNRMRIGRRHGS